MRQTDHCNINQFGTPARKKAFRHGILIIDIQFRIGDHARHRNAAFVIQHPDTRFQKLLVSPELIHNKPFYPLSFLFLQQCHGPVQLGKHAAPVDIPNEQYGRIQQLCQPHIDNIVFPQIDFGGTAGPLYDNHTIFLFQFFVGGKNMGNIFLFPVHIFHCLHIAHHFSVYDYLRTHFGVGFEQYGIHGSLRQNAGRFRLHHLCPSHFQPFRSNIGIQCHIL